MSKTSEKLDFLQRTARDNPEYREILPLFMELYRVIEGHERDTGISFAAPDDHDQARIAGGLPLLSAELMQVDEAQAARFLTAVVNALLFVDKKEVQELTLLRDAVGIGLLQLRPLLAGCLSRDRKALQDAAVAIGMSAPLLEFALEPVLKTALEEFSDAVAPSRVEGWQEGYCPVCGSRASMAELTGEEGKRQLCCSSCSYQWAYKRMKCPYCGNEETDSLSYFLAGEGPTRVDVCRKCSRYLKTRDARQGHAGVPMEVEDLTTMHLDLMAAKEGFQRGI
jgi:FdhE protein